MNIKNLKYFRSLSSDQQNKESSQNYCLMHEVWIAKTKKYTQKNLTLTIPYYIIAFLKIIYIWNVY